MEKSAEIGTAPYVEGRDFDLSREAARRLGMLRQGLLKVRVM